jgi:alcohol dehydrogenase YqhD (iron-dependent ADH family)
MLNFQFHTPTKIFFGKDTHKQVGEIIKQYGFKKILFHYGGGSIKRIGLYDQVIESLNNNNIKYVELGGVEPNPKLSLVRKGVQICKEEKVDMVLAAGGGSAIDSAKVIAVSALSEHDPWDFVSKKAAPAQALPVGTILTLAASGSEMSSSAVITNEDGELKRGFNSEFNRPLFSIMNPANEFLSYFVFCKILFYDG